MQDLVLLSDFISLPRLIKILCKGQVSYENYQHNTELLTVAEIEKVLTRIGKNHLQLQKYSDFEIDEDSVFPPSTISFEMNSTLLGKYQQQ